MAGFLSKEQARSHPLKNVVTRALGGESDVVVDVREVEVKPGDRGVRPRGAEAAPEVPPPGQGERAPDQLRPDRVPRRRHRQAGGGLDPVDQLGRRGPLAPQRADEPLDERARRAGVRAAGD